MISDELELDVFEAAASRTVDLGNRLLEQQEEADSWDVASGLLAGAVQFWLYTRQPCGDPQCESCPEVSTAEQRLRLLLEEIREYAADSDYYHSPQDSNVGRA